MTNAEMQTKLTAMTGEQSTEVLSTYLEIAGQKILRKAYPYDDTQTEVPAKYHYTQLEVAAYLLNKRGAEGEVSHDENGVKRTYENGDVPLSLMREVIPCVSLIREGET